MELSHVSQTQCMLAAQPSCARNAQTSRRAPSGQAWAGAGLLDAGQALPSLGAWSTSLADSVRRHWGQWPEEGSVPSPEPWVEL